MHQASLLGDRPAWLPTALAALVRHEFLTARQLAVVCETPLDGVAAALDALVRERLLVRLEPASLAGSRGEHAFALSRRGAVLAREVTGMPAVTAPNARRSVYLLDHELARNDVGVVLGAVQRMGLATLLRWETSRTKVADVATVVARDKTVRVPLVADALAIVEGADGHPTALLIETDRGTVSIARMRLKYAGYLAWWRDGGPERRFGIKSLRVVTLAPSTSRLDRLREAALAATDGRGSALLWFGEQRLVVPEDPARIFSPEWTTATTDTVPEPLLVPTTTAAADA